MREAYVHVFDHGDVSSWRVLVCQSEFFNLLCWFWLFCFVSFFYFGSRVGCNFCFCVGSCWPCLFVLLFASPHSVLALEAQLLLQSFYDCNGFVSELPMAFHRVFYSLYGLPLGICVDSISQLIGGVPWF